MKLIKNIIKTVTPKSILNLFISALEFFKFENQRLKAEDEWIFYKIHDNKFTIINFNLDYRNILNINKLVIDKFSDFSPGLYRLININKNINKQFLIKSECIILDLKNLMYIFVRGLSDEKKTFRYLYNKAMERNLVMLCGDQTTFVIDLLKKYYTKTKIRKIHFVTADEFNYYNDGHTSLEVQNIYKKWVLVDLQRDAMYLHKVENRYLSAFEIIKLKDSYVIEKLYKNLHFDIKFKKFRFNFTFFEQLSYSDAGHKMFVDRIMQILAISDDKENLFYTIKINSFDKKKINSHFKNAKFLEPDIFEKKFYLSYYQ